MMMANTSVCVTPGKKETRSCTPPLDNSCGLNPACSPAESHTPYSALKMLSRLASPHLREFEKEQAQRKSTHLRQLLEHSQEGWSKIDDEEEDDDDEEEDEEQEVGNELDDNTLPPQKCGKYTNKANRGEGKSGRPRKDKSLSLISLKFMELYGKGAHVDISLDAAANALGVERRRIYDIVNVLEGLEVVIRKAKNTYMWLGTLKLKTTLAKLRGLAETQLKSPPSSPSHTNTDHAVLKSAGKKDSLQKREKSLGVLAQRFVMMFLVSESCIVALDDAADRLIFGSSCPQNLKNKTKVRRLYDIANILISLHLIEKVNFDAFGMKRTSFKWIGISLDTLPPAGEVQTHPGLEPVTGRRGRKQSLLNPNFEDTKKKEKRPSLDSSLESQEETKFFQVRENIKNISSSVTAAHVPIPATSSFAGIGHGNFTTTLPSTVVTTTHVQEVRRSLPFGFVGFSPNFVTSNHPHATPIIGPLCQSPTLFTKPHLLDFSQADCDECS